MQITTNKNISDRKVAVVTGMSIILMGVLAGLVLGIFMGDILSHEKNGLYAAIQSAQTDFRIGVAGWVAILLFDIIAAWGLNEYYQSANPRLSLLTGWLRLSYAAILALAIGCLVLVLTLDSGIETADLMARWLLDGFQAIWSFGLIIFGFHLLGLGILVYRKNLLLKILSVLILLAGLGYVLTNSLQLLMPDYEVYKPVMEGIFMLPMILGEVGLGIFLLVRGGKGLG